MDAEKAELGGADGSGRVKAEPKAEVSEGWEQGSAHSSSEGSLPGSAPRRRSTRESKRTKFDDEIVESGPSSSLPVPPPGPPPAKSPKKAPSGSSPLGGPAPPPAPPQPSAAHKAPPAQGKKKGAAKSTSPCGREALEDLGRWTPTDDLALITAVMQTGDLEKVQTGIKFSCRFTLEDVQERWYALLYDSHISRVAVEGMRELPLDTVVRVQSNTLFKKQEESLLGTLPSASQPPPSLATMAALLEANPDVFHHARTPRSLLTHWEHLCQNGLLPDQRAGPWPLAKEGLEQRWREVEENLWAEGDDEALDPVAEAETELAERRLSRQLTEAEGEAGRWAVVVESVTGLAPPTLDPRTMAVLRGRLLRFLVRSKEISIGRSSRDAAHCVDVDLSLEGPAMRVSRKQATIKLKPSGDFVLANQGKRPLYVDGKPLLSLAKTRLQHNSVIEIASIRLVFLVNHALVDQLRQDATNALTL